MSSKETPLIEVHEELNASIGNFAGWRMPIDYGDPLSEALNTRKEAAVFDISHLSRIVVEGSDAENLLQKLIAKDVYKGKEGSIIGPTAFLNKEAGFKDDVLVYKVSRKIFLIVGNAINHNKILNWLIENSKKSMDVRIEDITFKTAMLALQGPKSSNIVSSLGMRLYDIPFFNFIKEINTNMGKVDLISISGWTGEEGYEFIGEPHVLAKLFKAFTEKGANPAGLGARDVLRIEMGFCLYGHEIDERVNPIEAKYWVFSWEKKGYVGEDALKRIIREGVDRVRVGIMLRPRSPLPRQGSRIYSEDVEIGVITSSTYSPVLKRPLALGYVNSRYNITGLRVSVETRSKKVMGKLVEPPFVK